MISPKIINFRIEPYVKEASIQIVIDVIVISLLMGAMSILGFPVVGIGGSLIYLVIAMIFHYRVLLCAIIDKRKGDYITKTVRIKGFKHEFSFAGNRGGESFIRSFYPKEEGVDRDIIYVNDEQNEKKKLRTVSSHRRRQKFTVLELCHVEKLRITYLKRSGIIIDVDIDEDINKIKSKNARVDV